MRVGKIKTLGNMGASLQHTFRERKTPNADMVRLKDNTIPLDDRGKLNARSIVGNKKALSDLQTDFVDRVADICDRVFPEPERMAEDQARFERALDTILEATEENQKRKDGTRVAIAKRSLPLVEKALAHFSEDQLCMALAYYNADIDDADRAVRLDVIERLTDIEYERLKAKRHTDTDRGPTH